MQKTKHHKEVALEPVLRSALARCRASFAWVGFFSFFINLLLVPVVLFLLWYFAGTLTYVPPVIPGG